jgi:hypothetical protein
MKGGYIRPDWPSAAMWLWHTKRTESNAVEEWCEKPSTEENSEGSWIAEVLKTFHVCNCKRTKINPFNRTRIRTSYMLHILLLTHTLFGKSLFLLLQFFGHNLNAKGFNPRKAPGYDLITGRMLEEMPRKCTAHLTTTRNSIIRTRYFRV